MVRAANWKDESENSTEVSETPTYALSPPVSGPTELSALALSRSQIGLAWAAISDNESGFKIQRLINGTVVEPLVTVGPDARYYLDENLSADTTYAYEIWAFNSKGDSDRVGAAARTHPVPSAGYVTADTATKGTWNGAYGTEGYYIYRQPTYDEPGFGYTYVDGLGERVTLLEALPAIWEDPSTDPRALQVPQGTERFAACHFHNVRFYADLNLPRKCRVSLYFVDWDTTSRRQTITITDAADATVVLDSRSISSSFNGGLYLTWDLAGHVRIEIAHAAGANAVLSGIFFDSSAIPSVTLTSPAPGATLQGTVALLAEASAVLGLQQVEFFANGSPIGFGVPVPDSADLWSFGWDTSTAVNGGYTLAAQATDTAGNATLSPSVSVSVNNDGGSANQPPTAGFSFAADGLTVHFTDASTDSDGTIVSWAWSFGDGNISSLKNPSHTYQTAGTYTVTLTVTDDDAATGTISHSVTVSDPPPTDTITLSANGYKIRGRQHVDLTWSGATSSNVDIHRDGDVIATVSNSGSYTDAIGAIGGGSYTYKVCETGGSACSNEVTVTF